MMAEAIKYNSRKSGEARAKKYPPTRDRRYAPFIAFTYFEARRNRRTTSSVRAYVIEVRCFNEDSGTRGQRNQRGSNRGEMVVGES